jgi:uncharacterized repeat protein (TIGR01451 family)
MSISKRLLYVLPIVALMAISALIVSPLSVVEGAPPLQGTPPARPTVSLPGVSSSPLSGKPIDSKIALALAVDKDEAYPGDSLQYKAQIDNLAGQEATNVWLTCDLPEGLEVQETTTTIGSVHNYGQRIAFELGRMQPAYESQYMTILARIRDDVQPGTELIHHANLTSDQAGGGERSIKTVILGEEPEESTDTLPLPTTGNKGISLWLAAGFIVLIVVVAFLTMRERILPR